MATSGLSSSSLFTLVVSNRLMFSHFIVAIINAVVVGRRRRHTMHYPLSLMRPENVFIRHKPVTVAVAAAAAVAAPQQLPPLLHLSIGERQRQ